MIETSGAGIWHITSYFSALHILTFKSLLMHIFVTLFEGTIGNRILVYITNAKVAPQGFKLLYF